MIDGQTDGIKSFIVDWNWPFYFESNRRYTREMFTPYRLPKPLISIGRSKVHATEESFQTIAKILGQHREVKFFAKKFHPSFWEGSLPLKNVIQKVGWGRYCRELFWIYHQRTLNGEFPDTITEDFQVFHDSMEDLENRFRAIETSAAKRIFLLLVYLEFTDLDAAHNFMDIEMLETLASVTDQAQNKNPFPDWFLIVVFHVLTYLGESTAFNLVAGNLTYQSVYEGLEIGQQKELTENLLTYGYSINHPDPFKATTNMRG